MKRSPVLAIACTVLLALGCSTNRDEREFFEAGAAGTLVLDALLVVGKPLPAATLSRTLSPLVEYTQEGAAERGASLVVVASATGDTIRYVESSVRAGTYEPVVAPIPLVQPNATYHVIAVTAAGELVRGRTTTPETFAVSDWVLLDDSGENVRRIFATYASAGDSVYAANSVVYADGLLEARFRRPNVPAFQVGVFSLDLDSDYVIEPEIFDEEDFADLDRQGASPALEGRDGTLRLPWFAIFFQGRYKLRILALDRNAFDYVRSTPQDNSGFAFGGNLGGRLERPIFHVEGGIGLVGSASADSVALFILPRP
jgi:hypothetical protein